MAITAQRTAITVALALAAAALAVTQREKLVSFVSARGETTQPLDVNRMIIREAFCRNPSAPTSPICN
ncbi:MAG: hypothetical protein WAO98_04230 [Alphaproteobacteria bacterium]